MDINIPYGNIDWTSFYGDVLGPVQKMAGLQKQLLSSDSGNAQSFSFADLASFGSGEQSATPFTDALKPEARDGVTGSQDGGGVVGGLIEGIEGTFARVAVIVLGFIFVAVGLSMFREG